jgi:hypothetical protein
MSRFAWTFYLCLSMVSIGINMIHYCHAPAEVLQFTGVYLVASGVGIPLAGWIVTSVEKKRTK